MPDCFFDDGFAVDDVDEADWAAEFDKYRDTPQYRILNQGLGLADFKVPRKVVILDEIPKGATGKLQRIGLAQKLGLAG